MSRNQWGGRNESNNEEANLLLELLQATAEEEGFVVKTFKDIGTNTSAYGGLEFERNDKTFSIMLDEV